MFVKLGDALIDADPALAAIDRTARADEQDRSTDDIFDRPRHWLALTCVRDIDQLGPRKQARAVACARDWLGGVADSPVITLGSDPGRWLYLVDNAGHEHLNKRTRAIWAGYSQWVYLDTGTVAYLPWRRFGDMIADAHEGQQLAVATQRRGHSSVRMHVADAELASLIRGQIVRPRTDTELVYRPLVAA
jgi:hypothetical protein